MITVLLSDLYTTLFSPCSRLVLTPFLPCPRLTFSSYSSSGSCPCSRLFLPLVLSTYSSSSCPHTVLAPISPQSFLNHPLIIPTPLPSLPVPLPFPFLRRIKQDNSLPFSPCYAFTLSFLSFPLPSYTLSCSPSMNPILFSYTFICIYCYRCYVIYTYFQNI